MDFLKTCKEPKTRLEIAEALKTDPIIVSHALRVLIRWKEIKFIEHDKDEARKKVTYPLNRRTKFYFTDDN